MVKANFMSIFNTDMTILLKFFFAEILLISLIFLFFDQKIRTIKKNVHMVDSFVVVVMDLCPLEYCDMRSKVLQKYDS